MRITNYEIINHGLEISDYFQGCGVSFTPYSYVVTGTGINLLEAINDALEQIAMSHSVNDGSIDELDRRMLEDNNLKRWPIKPHACLDENSEENYYISIRYNLSE